MSKVLQICTHSGSFHADEALAVYMLRLLPQYKHATLVRSRNPEIWEASDIVVDVSGKYDAVKFFDHHQREFETTFNEKYQTKLSSAGLVYKHFGKEIISQVCSLNSSIDQDKVKIDYLYDKIYSDFIEAVDANDNGINRFEDQDNLVSRFKDRNFSLAGAISNLNPSWDEEPTDADFDRQFLIASELIGKAFFNYLSYMGNSFLKAKQYVIDAYNNRLDVDSSGQILVFDRFVPWKEHLYNVEKENNAEGQSLFVLFPDSNGTWRIAAVPISSTSFDSRKKLPESWRGVRDEKLDEVTGVEGCVFVHAAGFIGGAKTKDAVIKLAKMSLESN
ncbi:Myg1 protein [Martiniozyma asiatica (nom. inval.)]|nr:Myg1 protein [Martiniozyma asiatica]